MLRLGAAADGLGPPQGQCGRALSRAAGPRLKRRSARKAAFRTGRKHRPASVPGRRALPAPRSSIMPEPEIVIRVGHSPDPDDAFMFYALARQKLDTGRYRFEHQLMDIETLNRWALEGRLELTAVSLHAYAYMADRYVLCTCGASMGEGYGPIVVVRRGQPPAALNRTTIAVPGTLTTAYLVLRLYLGRDFPHCVVPFDQILEAVEAGQYQGQPIGAGLVIHEGQLTYGDQGLELALDLGRWWLQTTGLPLPLGANAVRQDLGPQAMRQIDGLLRQSIEYALRHRDEALKYALHFGRGLSPAQAEQFVGMYVNPWTLNWGPRGRQACRELFDRASAAGVLPRPVTPRFVE